MYVYIWTFFQAKRQARKLNFLITQTELYAHFMATKLGTVSEADKNNILSRLEEKDGLKLHNKSLDEYGMLFLRSTLYE